MINTRGILEDLKIADRANDDSDDDEERCGNRSADYDEDEREEHEFLAWLRDAKKSATVATATKGKAQQSEKAKSTPSYE